MPEDILLKMPDGHFIKMPSGASIGAQDTAAQDYISSFINKPSSSSNSIEGGTIGAAPNDFLARGIGLLRSLLPASSTGVVNALPQEASKQEILGKGSPLIEGGAQLAVTGGLTALGVPPNYAMAAGSAAGPITNRIIKGALGQPTEVPSRILPNMGGLGSIIEDAGINEIGGRVMSPVLGRVEAAVGEKSFLDSSLGSRVKFEDLIDTTAGRGLLQSANNEAIDKIINDPAKLHNFLLNGSIKIDGKTIVSNNARKDAQGYVVSKIFDQNAENGALNADAMLKDFQTFVESRKKTSVKLFSDEQVNTYTDFFNSIKDTTRPGVDISNRLVRVDPLTKHFIFGSALFVGHQAGLSTSDAFIAAYITTPVIASILKNRTAAPIFLNMLKGQPLGMSTQAAGRIIMNTLTRQPITLTDKNGAQVEGRVNGDGQIMPR